MERKENFTQSVKNELSSYDYTLEQMKFILSGFLRNGASFSLGRKPTLHLRTEIAQTARLLFKALKECYGLNPKLVYEQLTRFRKGIRYEVLVSSERLYEVLEDLETLKDGIERLPMKEGLHRKNFPFLLIGLFLSSGSVNNPSTGKTSYFLEMAFNHRSDAVSIRKKLLSYKEEKTMNFKMIQRREKYVLYLKRSDQISVFLSLVGATEAMFSFENARIVKETININNRLSICDSANYGKTIETARRDIEGLKELLQVKSIELFDERTRQVIKTRMEHEDFNYREMAEFLTKEGFPITKSGVVHVIASLREEIAELRKRKG